MHLSIKSTIYMLLLRVWLFSCLFRYVYVQIYLEYYSLQRVPVPDLVHYICASHTPMTENSQLKALNCD